MKIKNFVNVLFSTSKNVVFLLFTFMCSSLLQATTSYDISTIAGSSTAYSGDGGVATAARLNNPFGVFVHSSGDIYFADTDNNVVRKIAAGTNVISTIAGTGTSGFAGDGGVATAALLSVLRGICLDTAGNIYIADSFNNRIRKIDANTRFISTIQSGLNRPRGICFDAAGNLCIADANNHRICKIIGGALQVIAGAGTSGFSGDGGLATAALLNTPSGIYIDNLNNIYIADTGNNHIRMIAGSTGSYFGSTRTANFIYNIAGGSVATAGFAGDGGLATADAVRLSAPYGVCLDDNGNAYIAENGNNRIRMIAGSTGSYFGSTRTANFIYTIAGTGTSGFLDGPATTALLRAPQGISIDSARNLYITENSNSRVRKLTNETNVISTIAGGIGDGGLATAASFSGLRQVCTDKLGNLYIADSSNNRIRKITTSTGIVSTLVSGLNNPFGVFVDNTDNLYVANFGNNTIGKYNSTTGSAINASFISGLNQPYGVFVDNAGIVYVGNYGNGTLGKYNNVGGVINASFISGLSGPTGVYSDSAGSIYVTCSAANSLRKYSGTGVSLNSNLIPGISNPNGVILDNSGNVYVADTGNSCIKMLSASNNSISIIASGLSSPYGLCRDSFNNIYVSNSGNSNIRKLLAKLTYAVSSGSTTTMSGAASTAYVTGGGTSILPSSNSIGTVEINDGILQANTSAVTTFNASAGKSAIMQISIGGITLSSALTFSTNGSVQIDNAISAILGIAPTGTGTMGKTGPGLLRVLSALNSSTTPVSVSQGTLEVSGSGKLPNAATSVASGAILQLGTANGTVSSGAVPGSTTIASEGIISVPTNVNVPNGALSNSTFEPGAIIQLGAGSTFRQNVTVGA